MFKLKSLLAFVALTLIPLTVAAQGGSLSRITNANGLINRLASIGTVAVYLLIALAVVYIVWKIVIYLIKGKEGDEKRHEAGMQILWGIVGLAIILSLWGLVNILMGTFTTSTEVPRDKFPTADFVNTPSGNSTYQGNDPYRGDTRIPE